MKNLLFLLAASFLISSGDLSAAALMKSSHGIHQATKPKKSKKKSKPSSGKGQKKLKSSKGKPHKDPAYR